MSTEPRIEPYTAELRPWARQLLTDAWGSPQVVSRGQLHQADALLGFVAFADGAPVGLLTYAVQADLCEVVTLNSLLPGRGAGTALIEAVGAMARAAGCQRLWLITTNDNLHALRFYQRRGFRLVALHAGALEAARRLKPTIPLLGLDDIPLRDEIELALPLADS